MISYNCLPPRGGGGGHCKPQFYYLHQLNANKTVMKSREDWKKECSPLQSTVGMSIPIFTWPVSSAHRGDKWKFFSPSPLLGSSIAFGNESQQKSVLLDISSAQYSRLTNANKFRLNTSLTSKGLSVTYLFLSWSLEAAVFKSNILKWTKKKCFFSTKKFYLDRVLPSQIKLSFLLLSLKTVTTNRLYNFKTWNVNCNNGGW
jgi:hypothetical protein